MQVRYWHVIYTRPRSEKKVAKLLQSKGFEVYCPLRRVRKRWSDRWKIVEEPLLASYLFVNVEDSTREDVFCVPGVVRYLFWLGKPARVRDEEINRLRLWLNEYSGEAITVENFRVNQNVRLASGPLMGQEGEVVRKEGNTLRLVVESLGVEICVDLRKTVVEKA